GPAVRRTPARFDAGAHRGAARHAAAGPAHTGRGVARGAGGAPAPRRGLRRPGGRVHPPHPRLAAVAVGATVGRRRPLPGRGRRRALGPARLPPPRRRLGTGSRPERHRPRPVPGVEGGPARPCPL
ncbi:MAG: hypothetical protein AVDCRST_MAG10-1854, partial [uncultured Acidimicrobiales bacterium]